MVMFRVLEDVTDVPEPLDEGDELDMVLAGESGELLHLFDRERTRGADLAATLVGELVLPLPDERIDLAGGKAGDAKLRQPLERERVSVNRMIADIPRDGL